jgi:hypothetical protein
MSVWDVFWLMCFSFFFIACLMVMFAIITDLFEDRSLGGWLRALWIVALIVLPLLSSLVYLVARGRGMQERSGREAGARRVHQDAYIRDVAARAAPADQIAEAKAMLDAGVIEEAEFQQLKAKALAT